MNIIVVDDHQLFLEGFSLLLKKLSHDVAITSVSTGKDFFGRLETTDQEWDLIILDLGIPDIDGLSLLKTIRNKKLYVPVVFVSATDNIPLIASTYYYGGSGFISKVDDTETMLLVLQLILDGDIYFPPDLKNQIEQELKNIEQGEFFNTALTARQKDVLKMLAQGASNKEIADQLSVSITTIKTHIRSIYISLNVNKRVECIRKAENLGLL